MGLRFSEDKRVPDQRFRTLNGRLGNAFEMNAIDSSPGNEDGLGRMAHSVRTEEVREMCREPAYDARKRVVEFLTERLT